MLHRIAVALDARLELRMVPMRKGSHRAHSA
jgi:hypothetical protein